jgi:hypothetical protein
VVGLGLLEHQIIIVSKDWIWEILPVVNWRERMSEGRDVLQKIEGRSMSLKEDAMMDVVD